VPKGLYSLRDRGNGTVLAYERFSCAAGPAGWRYAAEVLAPDGRTGTGLVDVTVDDRWRQLRVVVRSGAWEVRGGVVGAEVVWMRARASSGEARETAAVAAGFTGRSPGFLVAVARMLGLAPGGEVAGPAGRAERTCAGAADCGDCVGAHLGRGTPDGARSPAG